MREPKFTDAPCYGKEFEARSKICRVCLANKPCQRIFFKTFAVAEPPAHDNMAGLMRLRNSNPFARERAPAATTA